MPSIIHPWGITIKQYFNVSHIGSCFIFHTEVQHYLSHKQLTANLFFYHFYCYWEVNFPFNYTQPGYVLCIMTENRVVVRINECNRQEVNSRNKQTPLKFIFNIRYKMLIPPIDPKLGFCCAFKWLMFTYVNAQSITPLEIHITLYI
jgi:hypothetical protein